MREARAAYNHALALVHRAAERRLLERKRSEFTAA
jgi:predicted RNA polymerase sigma factor